MNFEPAYACDWKGMRVWQFTSVCDWNWRWRLWNWRLLIDWWLSGCYFCVKAASWWALLQTPLTDLAWSGCEHFTGQLSIMIDWIWNLASALDIQILYSGSSPRERYIFDLCSRWCSVFRVRDVGKNTRGSQIELGICCLGHSRLTDRARDVLVQSRLTGLSSGCTSFWAPTWVVPMILVLDVPQIGLDQVFLRP